MNEQIERKEDAALLAVLTDINDAPDEVAQHRAIERYLKLSVAIAVKNGEFNHAAFSQFNESLLTRKTQ
jgi:hypothetical protein